MPAPEMNAVTTNSSRISTGSTSKYSPRPPATPAIIFCERLRYSRLGNWTAIRTLPVDRPPERVGTRPGVLTSVTRPPPQLLHPHLSPCPARLSPFPAHRTPAPTLSSRPDISKPVSSPVILSGPSSAGALPCHPAVA